MDKILIGVGIYLFLINLITFIVYWVDKIKARRNSWRVPEKTLHLLALVGGVWGAIAAMVLVRHKTKKKSFFLLTILITILNIAALGAGVYYYIL
ncbi:MAG: DUF1294 domain-containing protein [Candidatus Thermoplasmatota archaeon]|jgi:uncharacterized membrane protein YsdA (DUF1294 family)|nr:DUF1294 domain-containing protein [Candidatus Thermoplasmatota archaeon]MDP7265177.1 DUF1294 domain-containing protein [Candidatus Thermoplasmatota archaeon]